MLKCRGVQRERIPAGLNPSLFRPISFERIASLILQNVQALCERGLLAAGREIQIPFTFDKVNFGCPHIAAHDPIRMLLPYNNGLAVRKLPDRLRSAKLDTIVLRNGSCKIVITVTMTINPRVRPLQNHWIRNMIIWHNGF
ncbi:hypothetical protein D3C71_1536030 [compost metagenome]